MKEEAEKGLKGLHRNRKGAVLVEFLIAFMPLMMMFSSFLQVAQVATASLIGRHATVVAARAAAVITDAHKNTPDAQPGDNKDDIVAAYTGALGPWKVTMSPVNITIDDASSKDDNFGMVTVTATTDYTCSVPFGNRLVCTTLGGTHEIKNVVKFPHQGACYKDLTGGGC